jgi:hypothetical protein
VRVAILVQASSPLWLALTEDRSEYIRDPSSTGAFPQMAGWPSADAARADLARWGFTVLLPPKPRYVTL